MVPESLGILETTGLTPALVALDTLEKTAGIRLLQVEWNDFYGVVIKVLGDTAAVSAALAAGFACAERLGGRPIRSLLSRPEPRAWPALESPPEYNPLIEQSVVMLPATGRDPSPATRLHTTKELTVAESSYALGLIETQGFTAVFEAIDSACKAANVEVVCKEKLGGGYITVIIRGDVAAVKAAVEAGQQKVEGLGKLIAAHVIARPSPAVLSLLPKT
ncbi:MAG: BMC domain-containing protein [Pirellulales bacterium]